MRLLWNRSGFGALVGVCLRFCVFLSVCVALFHAKLGKECLDGVLVAIVVLLCASLSLLTGISSAMRLFFHLLMPVLRASFLK